MGPASLRSCVRFRCFSPDRFCLLQDHPVPLSFFNSSFCIPQEASCKPWIRACSLPSSFSGTLLPSLRRIGFFFFFFLFFFFFFRPYLALCEPLPFFLFFFNFLFWRFFIEEMFFLPSYFFFFHLVFPQYITRGFELFLLQSLPAPLSFSQMDSTLFLVKRVKNNRVAFPLLTIPLPSATLSSPLEMPRVFSGVPQPFDLISCYPSRVLIFLLPGCQQRQYLSICL